MRLIVSAFCALLSILAKGQGPSPCGTPALMTPTCQEACVICDINGFTGRNDNPAIGTVPPGFCTMNVQNAQWIAFIAGSTSLVLTITASNCANGNGLQLGLYKGDDCTNFARISNCINPLDPGSVGTFTSNVPLTIGQYYWLIIDGNQGDVCDYTVNVISGTTAVTPLVDPPILSGPSIICSNTVSTFRLTPPVGATDFEWEIDGTPIGTNADSVEVSIPSPGQYLLCAKAKNACDIAPIGCYPITVKAPAVTSIDTFFCASRCIMLEDSSICTAGSHTFGLKTMFGCDSIVTYTLTEVDAVISPVSVFICDGDTLFVGPFPYTTTGMYSRTLPTTIDCDSTILLDLTVVICQINATSGQVPVTCNGADDGQLSVLINNGTPPFTYQWSRLGSSPAITGNGNVSGLNQASVVPDLSPGLYAVTISDLFGNVSYLLQDITEPDSLKNTLQINDYQGFGVSCPDAQDGSIQLQTIGGVLPYSASWSTGETSLTGIEQLSKGTYTVTITDAKQCTLVSQVLMQAPDSLALIGVFTDPDCSGYETGNITISSVTGGVPPYILTLGSDTTTTMIFDGLVAGQYTIEVSDQNGCSNSLSGNLAAPPIPEVFLPDTVTIDLGDSTLLSPILNQYANQFVWAPPLGLSCIDCPRTEARPAFTTKYILTVTSTEGCERADSIEVRVIAKYDVSVPNVFNPNQSGANTLFYVFGGPEVVNIERFEVYSRWGELVHQRKNIQPNDPNQGWDGRFRGKFMDPGVYAWIAVVSFLDGKIIVYRGDLTLVS
jgi:gliding motility-associated-like protein